MTLPDSTDWIAWHSEYENSQSPLSRRRRVIQEQVRVWLEHQEARRLRVVSVCAGDGRDLLEVLAESGQRAGLQIVLIELDAELVEGPASSPASAVWAAWRCDTKMRVRR